MSAVDDHQTNEPAQPGCRQFPGELGAGAVADYHRPPDPQRVEDADHRLGGQPRVRADNDGPKRRGVQALTHRVIRGGRALLGAEDDDDDAILRTGHAHGNGKPSSVVIIEDTFARYS